ncbi:MAG: hypothetical protein NTW04_04260, partial [Elusimicrobia bacterium]|nr:hypothetical protein [Elusimicrobiota bacterium]
MEGFCVRQISDISGHSPAKIKRIKNYWLTQVPHEVINYRSAKYLIFDGTYFNKNGCSIAVMEGRNGRVIANGYVKHECYDSA